MEALYQFSNKLTPISRETFKLVSPFLKHFKCEANTILCNVGDEAKYVYFIVSGIVRTSVTTEKGKIFTRELYTNNQFCGPMSDMIQDKPSSYIYETLTDCEVIRSEHKEIQNIYQATLNHQLMLFEIKIHEILYISMEKTIINLGTKDAKERYLSFLERFVGIEKLVPQYQIASYLGITPIQLSRIRKGLREN
jgi:CRP-like cAMP-binding protein